MTLSSSFQRMPVVPVIIGLCILSGMFIWNLLKKNPIETR